MKIGRRNVNNLRYADYMLLLAGSSNDLKGLLMKVKEESITRNAFAHQEDKSHDYISKFLIRSIEFILLSKVMNASQVRV